MRIVRAAQNELNKPSFLCFHQLTTRYAAKQIVFYVMFVRCEKLQLYYTTNRALEVNASGAHVDTV
jgi:hypothetical protein